MLTEQEKGIIKETVPVLQEKGTDITSYFYNRMFNQHPELRNMFNQTNQKQGLQSTALAQSVLAAAMNIDDLTNILPVVKEIGHKHCALQVPAAGYDIVGENLLAAIENVLGLESDDPILQTWAKAYGEIADVFIQVEKDIYNEMAWEDFQPFTISKIETISSDIKAFTVTSDKHDLSQFNAGQYITVDIDNEKLPYRAKRHYSIVEGDKDHLTFAVKRDVTDEHEGEVSPILHDEFKEGDTILLSAPVGVFGVVNEDKPQLFIGSGVGVTPLISMYKQVAATSPAVTFVQNVVNADDVPYGEALKAIAEDHEHVEHVLHDRQSAGRINAETVQSYITDDTEIYVCGGTQFLESVINSLKASGVDEAKIHFESFKPKLAVAV
ncbi:nitric oxide dioxygenase [Staphylococcus auricularis]|uniref:nitric oxide dioxygenase n=1 Tax=Staphylococcus auricularis TaxID=29379 RepID=A0AAP8PQ24_9STAP|nr:globin domain-containing protein [Staphylococcus auricularis]MDC6326371.1 globin domain-containing protein [Staphylococcus auricularis]MDN4532248.1 globin domain-containing protein [Staphylococcus auricularis]PNZ68349.1 nitric oxide dioxygenase [Staphylococcus auricularis]QPT05622.1 nitric oxide dioxygenase [Staphylococcus auricularis]SQJ09898.1 flavohemoprotein [Staphylococcus auricularis]